MSQDPQQTTEDKSPEEIREDIKQTREELGDTVEALGAKSDVKGRAQAKVEDVKSQAKAKVEEVKDKVTPSGDSGTSSSTGDEGGAAAAKAKAAEGGQAAVATVQRNPLPFAVAAALLLGILIGRRGTELLMAKAFTPVSVIAGLLAGVLANKIFTFVWGKIIDEEPPDPKHREINGVQLVGSLALQGAITKLVKGGVDHGLRHAVARSSGTWPGEERPEPE